MARSRACRTLTCVRLRERQRECARAPGVCVWAVRVCGVKHGRDKACASVLTNPNRSTLLRFAPLAKGLVGLSRLAGLGGAALALVIARPGAVVSAPLLQLLLL